MNLEIQNKNALVCGSTAGIGKATAILLAKEGANVTLIARNEEKLKSVLQELSKSNEQNFKVFPNRCRHYGRRTSGVVAFTQMEN